MDFVQRIYNFLPLALYIGVNNGSYIEYVQCCHGGIELGFNPFFILSNQLVNACQKVTKIERIAGANIIKKMDPSDFIVPHSLARQISQTELTIDNGFMLSHFDTDPKALLKEGRGNGSFGGRATQILLNAWSADRYRLKAIFRAHQHMPIISFHDINQNDPMMNRILNLDLKGWATDAGVGKLWCTRDLNSPGSLALVKVLTFAVSLWTPYNMPYDAFGLVTFASHYDDWQLNVYRIDKKTMLIDRFYLTTR